MAKTVVVFDLDDTLFAERDYVVSGFSAIDWLLVCQYGRSGFKDMAMNLFDRGCRTKLIDRSLVKLGVTVTDGFVQALVNVYRSHSPKIDMFEDARGFLTRIKDSHLLAVLSDGPLTSQVNKARALRTDEWCTAHVFTDLWGREHWKPAESGFRHLQNLFPDSRHFVYIADNPMKDFLAPRRLGWHTIRIMRESGLYANVEIPEPHRANLTVSTFDELLSI